MVETGNNPLNERGRVLKNFGIEFGVGGVAEFHYDITNPEAVQRLAINTGGDLFKICQRVLEAMARKDMPWWFTEAKDGEDKEMRYEAHNRWVTSQTGERDRYKQLQEYINLETKLKQVESELEKVNDETVRTLKDKEIAAGDIGLSKLHLNYEEKDELSRLGIVIDEKQVGLAWLVFGKEGRFKLAIDISDGGGIIELVEKTKKIYEAQEVVKRWMSDQQNKAIETYLDEYRLLRLKWQLIEDTPARKKWFDPRSGRTITKVRKDGKWETKITIPQEQLTGE